MLLSTMHIRCCLAWLGIVAISVCRLHPNAHAHAHTPAPAKNAILFIGDGMGSAAVTATRAWLLKPEGQLAMDRLPVSGLLRTSSSSDLVTDSAAAATAMATGVKTYNGAIGVRDPSGSAGVNSSRSLVSILTMAHAAGKAVGIVTTTRVTDATPAAFYAHAPQRSDEESIAAQVDLSKLDLLMGGGRAYFFPGSWQDRDGQDKKGRRSDTRNIVNELRQRGWRYMNHLSELLKQPEPSSPPDERLIALFAYNHLPYEQSDSIMSGGQALLSRMVHFAITRLQRNPTGFFLIVEGGRIDHAAHANHARNVLGEVAAFDQSIATARSLTSDKSTLVVVTADHETGGLALSGPIPRQLARGEGVLGSMDDGRIAYQARHFLSFATGPGFRAAGVDPQPPLAVYPATYFLPMAAHTAVDVPLYAGGPHATLFTGSLDNTEIAWRLAQALNLHIESLNDQGSSRRNFISAQPATPRP